MTHKLASMTFYKNTPFTDFVNTLHYKSNSERDRFFDTHYEQKNYDRDKRFNFIRDRNIVRVDMKDWNYNDWSQVNYVRFISDFDGILYYAQVVETTYKNNNCVELSLVIDGLMTFCQGELSHYAKNVMIDRQHLKIGTFNSNLKYLRTNGDVLDFNTMSYVHQALFKFDGLYVIIRSSADLESDFGNEDNPKFKTSSGVSYDGVTSPQNIYCLPYSAFNQYMKNLSKFPWIAQNISSVLLIPNKFLNLSDLDDASTPSFSFTGLKKFKNGSYSKNIGTVRELSFDWNDIYINMKAESDFPEIMRDGYAKIEMTNNQGQKVPIAMSGLPKSGLEIYAQIIVGYDNAVYFFPRYFNSDGENGIDELFTGGYLDNALVFKDWDNVPMLIDNYRLAKANSANERALNENNQISGQVGNVMDNSQSLKDRMMSAVNLTSSMTMGAISGKLVDEWQFYRRQQAQFADKAISAPSLTNMTNNNSFAIKQKFFGVTLKFSRISDNDQKAVMKYHSNFGYQWNRLGDVDNTQSMSHLNYVKFSGNWVLDDRNVPQSIMEQIRIQFETGVKLWHNPENVDRPFTQDLTYKNRRIL